MAERTGVIDALGDWVVHAVCAQGREWQKGGLNPNFGINVSPSQLPVLHELRELPVQVIKIDRSFLRDVPEDPQTTRIFAAMLRLADACGYEVVAEGVETSEQLQYLATEGCRLAQGFHLGRPTTAELIEPILAAGIAPERVGAAS